MYRISGEHARPSAVHSALWVSWPKVAALLPGLVVGTLGAVDGGFFPKSWGWATVALAALAALAALVREEVAVGRLEALTVAVWTAVVAWIALSMVWSSVPGESRLEAERALVYLAALAAASLVLAKNAEPVLVAGVLAALTAVCGDGLVTRLFPGGRLQIDPYEGTMLVAPVGYANALGILAALGVLLAIAVATHVPAAFARAAAAAATPFLVATLALTESRGAWLALGAGFAAELALDRRRWRLVATAMVLALPIGLSVWLGLRASALRDPRASVAELAHEGHRLAVVLAVLAAVAATASLAAGRVESLLRGSSRLLVAGVLMAVVAAGAALALTHAVSTPGFAGDRPAYWRVAWRDVEANPILGSGAGTFGSYWLQHGPRTIGVRDAHNLYLETLAELGPLGLALLAAALVLPLAAIPAARKQPLAAGAAGAYAAYLVHAGLDWDWEMPAVTLAGLFCAAGLLAAARAHSDTQRLGVPLRLGLLAGAAVLGGLAVAGLAAEGNLAF
jgi:O-Antigen ligase